jgi:hypothetical protein
MEPYVCPDCQQLSNTHNAPCPHWREGIYARAIVRAIDQWRPNLTSEGWDSDEAEMRIIAVLRDMEGFSERKSA